MIYDIWNPHLTEAERAEIERMMDALVASEGEPDLLQISGGEPTIHPQILDIIAAAKRRPIRHVMLNTNGVRIAKDKDFVKALAELKPGFEVYLQFDSLRPEVLRRLRGRDLTAIRQRALESLERHAISTTLVAVVEQGSKIRLGQFGKAIHREDGTILDNSDTVSGII